MNFSKLAPWNWFKDEDSSHKKQESFQTLAHPNSVSNLFELMENFMKQTMTHFEQSPLNKGWFKPSVDVGLSDQSYSIEIEVPGVDVADINLEVIDNRLIVKGEKRGFHEDKRENYYRVERSYGSFHRVLNLPQDANIDAITSKYARGVLHINIPKKEIAHENIKKIPIAS